MGEVEEGGHPHTHMPAATAGLSLQNRTCRASVSKLPASLHGSRRASSSLVGNGSGGGAAAAAAGEEEGLRQAAVAGGYDDEGEDSQQAAAGASWSHAASSCGLVRPKGPVLCGVQGEEGCEGCVSIGAMRAPLVRNARCFKSSCLLLFDSSSSPS